ncbi:uncharacterized protein TNCV_170601 [Trichonephila clavipes]|nr:uncharacterized protein TNCV_170601 [Trichonephila clavipes]
MQGDCALRIDGRGRLTSFSVEYETGNQSLFECAESFTKQKLRYTCHYAVFEDRGVGTNGSEKCHLNEDQAQDTLDRPVVRRPPHRKKYKRTANCFIGRHPGIGSTFTKDPCVFSNLKKAPG